MGADNTVPAQPVQESRRRIPDKSNDVAVVPRTGESKDQRREADRLTQLGRVLRELGIGSILVLLPQATRRVERSFF